MIVGILALQGDFREHAEMLASIGRDSVEVRRPEQLGHCDALIIPGGESTTIARLIRRYDFPAPLREFCASGKPVWGTCAGAILLARSVDDLDRPGLEVLDIAVSRNAFGRQRDSFEADVTIAPIDGGPFHAVFIRAPRIESVGGGVEVVGRLASGEIVAAQQGNLLATAFHPELTNDPRLHQYFLTIGTRARSASGSRP